MLQPFATGNDNLLTSQTHENLASCVFRILWLGTSQELDYMIHSYTIAERRPVFTWALYCNGVDLSAAPMDFNLLIFHYVV